MPKSRRALTKALLQLSGVGFFVLRQSAESVWVSCLLQRIEQRDRQSTMARTKRAARPADSESATEEEDDAPTTRSSKRKPTKRARAAKPSKKKPQWEWQQYSGGWQPFAADDSKLLEEHRGESKFETTGLSFNRNGTKYLFVLSGSKMTQLNTSTRKVRNLRRVLIDAGDDDTASDDDDDGSDDDGIGYAKLVKKSSVSWGKGGGAAASAAGKRGKKAAAAPAIKPLGKLPAPLSVADIKKQAALGAQSRRSQKADYGPAIKADPHGTYCFDRMLENEARLSGEFACVYHSYSFAALLYEVQAAVAAVLFRFKSNFASLPRLLKTPYNDIPDAPELLKIFPKFPDRDHNSKFRAVAISVTTSLLGPDMEAPPKQVFLMGYSCSDLSFRKVLEDLLESCHVPKAKVSSLATQIVKLSEKHGLDVSQFKGKRCASGRPGHLLQIFLKRELVDRFAYASLPYGVVEKKRQPLSATLGSAGPIHGQARVVTHPSIFLQARHCRMFVYSADPTFHGNREKFQKELTQLLKPILGAPETRVKAATGIHGGALPSWFKADDQSNHSAAKVTNHYK
eukprot:m.170132 g.170132  ORF g.170132 m.170132 type:complete len:569 (-) comp17822_c1_seq4:146-1852(-)